mgnify:CR=1 FL=1
MERKLKIGLAALLFICLLDMPYGYYQLVRTFATFAFALFAFRHLGEDNRNMAFLCFGLAFLFQPLIKIPLGREIWNAVDLIVGVGLLVSAFKGTPEQKNTAD